MLPILIGGAIAIAIATAGLLVKADLGYDGDFMKSSLEPSPTSVRPSGKSRFGNWLQFDKNANINQTK